MKARLAKLSVFIALATLAPLTANGVEDPEISAIRTSPSGRYIAYVLKGAGVRRQALWLSSQGEARQVLSWEELKKIKYLYTAAVGNLAWSPSEQYLSFDVWDGDVELVSSVYDVESGTVEILKAAEGNAYHAAWHPREEIIFFKGGKDSLQNDSTIYRYEVRTRAKSKICLPPGAKQFQPTEAGLVVVMMLSEKDQAGPKRMQPEIRLVPYSDFK
jgi:dipeptidyl aminopeptidase/acylaminoacyl peptidase